MFNLGPLNVSIWWKQHLMFQGPFQSGFLAFFEQDRDRTGLQKFPFWEKTEPDWEKPVYIGPVLS